MRIRFTLLFALAVSLLQAQGPLQPLKVSANGRYFQTADGKPFFWLGDTGWLLFVKCNREQAIQYLNARQQQGFNVIQVMVLHDLSNSKNAYGDSALFNLDASHPRVTPGNDYKNKQAYDYWDHIDFIVDEAAKRGLYMALVPVWGSNVKAKKVNVKQAEIYARFLAERYGKRTNIIWLNGGDLKGTEGQEVWETIGKTLRMVDKTNLIGFHPRGRYSSSDWFHKAPWLDFNMFQSGHKDYDQDTIRTEKNRFGEDNWKYVNVDYNLKPTKPTLDGEPSYENIPHGLHDSLQPRWTAADLRRYGYWSVFAGGAGFTYGENSIMQFHNNGDPGANYGVNKTWQQTLNAPGATQMKYLKQLMLSFNTYFDRVPAQEILTENLGGARYKYLLATRGKGYAMVYTFTPAPFGVALYKIGFTPSKASWYNPVNGEKKSFETDLNRKMGSFQPPAPRADGGDWVLILEQ